MEDFIRGIPKCELHMHVCGNTEPELVFKLAQRNNVKIPYDSPEDLRKAYSFNNLQEFLDAFMTGTMVIKKPQDIYDITYDYLKRAADDNVKYCELHADPQLYPDVLTFQEAAQAYVDACKDGEKNLGIKARLILCQQRFH